MSYPDDSARRTELNARRAQKILAALGAAALIYSFFALWTSTERDERAALRHMPEAERRALYERTLHTLESTCRPANRADGLGDLCREQAELILRFPECDSACRTLAQAQRGTPTR